MVVLPMQRINGDNDGIYTPHMSHFTAGMLGLPCRPCSGPRQLKFGDYLLVVIIMGVLGMASLHLRHYPFFQYRDFYTKLEWELVWDDYSLLTASNMLNYSLQKIYY